MQETLEKEGMEIKITDYNECMNLLQMAEMEERGAQECDKMTVHLQES